MLRLPAASISSCRLITVSMLAVVPWGCSSRLMEAVPAQCCARCRLLNSLMNFYSQLILCCECSQASQKRENVAHRRCASESKLSFMTRHLACLSVCESEVWKREVPAGKVEAGKGTSPFPSISGSGRWSAPLWILLLLWEDATTPQQQLWPPDSYTGTLENCWILF